MLQLETWTAHYEVHGLCYEEWSMACAMIMVCIIGRYLEVQGMVHGVLLGMVHDLCYQELSMIYVIRNGTWSMLLGMVHGLHYPE